MTLMLCHQRSALVPPHPQRLAWTHFEPASVGLSKGGGNAVDIDVRGGTVVLALNTNVPLVEVGALPGSGVAVGGPYVGYVAVLPTLAQL